MTLAWRPTKWDTLSQCQVALGRDKLKYTVESRPNLPSTLIIHRGVGPKGNGEQIEKREFPDVHIAKTMAQMWEENKYWPIMAVMFDDELVVMNPRVRSRRSKSRK